MTRPGEPHDGSGQDRLEIVLGPERLARDLLRAGGMSVEQLTTYLNDHVGGSVAALELLDHLSEAHAGTPSERLFKELRADIEQDQGQLKELLRRLGGEESSVTKAAGWLGEKLGRGKMWLDDEKNGDFRLVESLELLALGIQGKMSLWRTLAVVAERLPALAGVDFASLQRRAREQQDRVEMRRLEAARTAFTS